MKKPKKAVKTKEKNAKEKTKPASQFKGFNINGV